MHHCPSKEQHCWCVSRICVLHVALGAGGIDSLPGKKMPCYKGQALRGMGRGGRGGWKGELSASFLLTEPGRACPGSGAGVSQLRASTVPAWRVSAPGAHRWSSQCAALWGCCSLNSPTQVLPDSLFHSWGSFCTTFSPMPLRQCT